MTGGKRILQDYELSEKKWLNTSYYSLRFNAPEIAKNSNPGQFINLRASDTLDPLLRRPLSIFRCNRVEGWIEFLVKPVGKGTKLISKTKTGDQFSLLGPLGNSFQWQKANNGILVGGGIGIAPLVFLAEEMVRSGKKPTIIWGFQSKRELCCVDEMKALETDVYVTTDDGSYGFHGLVTEKLAQLLRESPELREATVFACGPNPMMAALEKICDDYSMDAYFSLEAHMACGFGACVGCAVPSHDRKKYYLVCEEGPVFHKGDVYLGP